MNTNNNKSKLKSKSGKNMTIRLIVVGDYEDWRVGDFVIHQNCEYKVQKIEQFGEGLRKCRLERPRTLWEQSTVET